MIEANGLTKLYGPLAAIQGVAFHVDQGEIVGFLGPNAAGKTTTMRILTGSTPATSGTARIAGFDVADNPLEVKRRVGYLPENVPLYPEMRVSAFLSYVAEIKGVVHRERSREVGRVLECCGLSDVARRVIRNLSKGYRQRVGLAQALINDPPVLILDEPTVGLDPRQIVEIRQMIKDLAQKHTVLLSTHILPEVAMVCERVVIINQGRVVAEDSMQNLAGRAANAVLEIEVRGAKERIVRLLGDLPGVAKASSEGADVYVVEPTAAADTPDASLAETVAQALVHAGFGVRGLRTRTHSLEAVFLEAISETRDIASSGALS